MKGPTVRDLLSGLLVASHNSISHGSSSRPAMTCCKLVVLYGSCSPFSLPRSMRSLPSRSCGHCVPFKSKRLFGWQPKLDTLQVRRATPAYATVRLFWFQTAACRRMLGGCFAHRHRNSRHKFGEQIVPPHLRRRARTEEPRVLRSPSCFLVWLVLNKRELPAITKGKVNTCTLLDQLHHRRAQPADGAGEDEDRTKIMS
jgi:hypothetical protein